ncbi:hypothetical protein ACIA5D_13185 [Actinoplanes sp. NPDC051513]|uniref:hypothetical protein n=1 Tax=Actinoplanes sp. NPDC051513 TaxID=3363908 RepID=UPI0037A70FCB
MIRTAVMPSETAATPQVFVDSTGRRKRLLAIFGFLVAIFAALYIGIVGERGAGLRLRPHHEGDGLDLGLGFRIVGLGAEVATSCSP